MPDADINIIRNPERLAALYALNLLDTPKEEAFDRLTRLAVKVIGVPISTITLVDHDRQFYKSAVGLGEPLMTQRQTPLSHALCQHVVATGEPLIAEDAHTHPLLYDNLAVRDSHISGYVGMPLFTPSGLSLGTFCVMDKQPRRWTTQEIDVVRELAMCTTVELELRAEMIAHQRTSRQLQAIIDAHNTRLKHIEILADTAFANTLSALEKGIDAVDLIDYLRSTQTQLRNATTLQ